MSDLEKEFQQYDACGYWPVHFQGIKNEAAEQAMVKSYETSDARKPENRSKNRYRDVSPYDHSRVRLQNPQGDYINASLVQVPDANRQYILAQGPLEQTVGQFWEMIWEQRCRAVIMLNRVMEKGTVKCHQYWPLGSHNGGDDELVLNEVQLKVTLVDEEELSNYVIRTLDLEDLETGVSREILHFHYITWPDFGVPSSPDAFLDFLLSIRQSGSLDVDVGPAVIHCSAGIGRSGTFCLVDSCLVMIEKSTSLDSIDLRQVLVDMRSFRMGLIQTADQLRFSYLSIIEGGKKILNKGETTPSIDSGFSEDGPPAPPPRTSSLSPARSPNSQQQSTEAPPKPARLVRQSVENGTDNDAVLERLQGSKNDSTYEVRRRKREERKKNTESIIKQMKEKQKKSELWKKRKTYLRPICIGLSILLGGLLLYKIYYR